MTSHKILASCIIFCISLLSLNNIFCIKRQIEKIRLESNAFKNNKAIPKKYTQEDANYSPPLSWNRVTQKAKSLAIICDDPDAPRGTFVHWFIYNIPVSFSELPENIQIGEDVTQMPPTKQGNNDFGKHGWSGPFPPHGTHRYIFRIYALDTYRLDLPEKTITKEKFIDRYSNNIIGYGELIGLYTKAEEKESAVAKTQDAAKIPKQPFVKKQKNVNDCGY